MRSFKAPALFQCLAVIAVAAPLLAGCNDSSPTEPVRVATATPVPTPTPFQGSNWNNTVEVVAVTTGAANCLVGSVGQVSQTTFFLKRTGDSVSFNPPDPLESPTYTGTASGATFTATSPAEDANFPPCGRARFTKSLSGRFSDDGNHMSATEIWSYAFDAGGVWAVTYSWSATRF